LPAINRQHRLGNEKIAPNADIQSTIVDSFLPIDSRLSATDY
jgi:hypothetical protein